MPATCPAPHDVFVPPRARSRRVPGGGSLEVSLVGAFSTITRSRSTSPLKLLVPRPRGQSAWVFTSTFGGGLVSGDDVRLDMTLAPGTTCLLGTQASTKVYRSTGLPCRQTLNVTVGTGATCVVAPHPVTCFAEAAYVQRQRFDLHPGASLVLVDWLTSGRHMNGERWVFDSYDSRTDIFVGDRHVFRDALRLIPADGPIEGSYRTGGFDCLAYAVVLGEALGGVCESLQGTIESHPVMDDRTQRLLFGSSRIPGGLLVRVAGVNAESVARWLRDRLAFVAALLGQDPFSRLW